MYDASAMRKSVFGFKKSSQSPLGRCVVPLPKRPSAEASAPRWYALASCAGDKKRAQGEVELRVSVRPAYSDGARPS